MTIQNELLEALKHAVEIAEDKRQGTWDDLLQYRSLIAKTEAAQAKRDALQAQIADLHRLAEAERVEPEPEYWQWRRKAESWGFDQIYRHEVYATTDDSEVRKLFATPPAVSEPAMEDFCGVQQEVRNAETSVGTKYTIEKWECPTCKKPCSSLHIDDEHCHGDGLAIGFKNGIRKVMCSSCWLPAAVSAPLDEEPDVEKCELIYDATKSLSSLMKEAQVIVESKHVFKKFIRATPLENDVAVWMAEFAKNVLCEAASVAPPAAVPQWMPIESAPKDNKQPLLIANFNDEGVMTSMDWDASYEQEQESWEIPQLYWIWCSANGNVEEPTHWMYQPEWFVKTSEIGEKQ